MTQIHATPHFALASDGCLLVATASYMPQIPIILSKIAPSGETLWKREVETKITYYKSWIQAGAQGGAIFVASGVSLTSATGQASLPTLCKRSQKILALDAQGNEHYALELEEDAELVGVQSSFSEPEFGVEEGEVFLLFQGMDYSYIHRIRADGKGRSGIILDSLSRPSHFIVRRGLIIFAPNFLAHLPTSTEVDTHLLEAGWSMPEDTPSLDTQYAVPGNLLAISAAPDHTGFAYAAFLCGEGSGTHHAILRLSLLEKEKFVLFQEPIYQLEGSVFEELADSSITQTPFALMALPRNHVAVLDGCQSMRLTVLDGAGKLVSRNEYVGKGFTLGEALFYEEKSHTLHAIGQTMTSADQCEDRTFFWIRASFSEEFLDCNVSLVDLPYF